ncbi:Hsp70 family protein [Catellatospora tritici]|uniref:Hsp70 family protein n=1 Tax=Catellatospora tritici TaxID=2851566 RepID=UPI001C2D3CAB|nr:Hsp70 family protein [Catellatospora tritici]MBV1850916.1 Hsp70 family protein [Catellatospora tritici]MBV1851169.1 Hsp70 family protein [Catellatospora tritici]
MNTAIVVGCSSYEDPDIAPLRFAARDAQAVARVLRDSCDVPAERLVLMHDEAADPWLRPTKSNILRQLVRARDLTADGILYFFFSGHGIQSRSGTQFLLPLDCVSDEIEDTALPFDRVVQHLGRADAPHTVLMLDACRNVVEGGKSAGGAGQVDIAALCPSGVVSLCSCQPGRVSYEAEALQSGIFSAALCEALSDIGRCRTVHELDTYLARRVPELAVAHGKPRQTPFSRVEPLGVQHLELVSPSRGGAWAAATPLGVEVRTRRVPPVPRARPSSMVAVDFGTSYSLVAALDTDGKPLVLPGPDNRLVVPSVVHLLPGSDYVVGAAAVEAERFRPEATIRHAKRRLGTDRGYTVDGRSISPELAASLILRSLRRNAEEALGIPVTRCVASYPANFSRAQLAALREAFRLAEWDAVRFVGEPNLAGMVTDAAEEDQILVVDLGGGTFDVALVDYLHGIAELRSSVGSQFIGGLDFDEALFDYAVDQLRGRHGYHGELTPEIEALIRREAERAKRELGRQESATMLLTDLPDGQQGYRDVSIGIDRPTFRLLTQHMTAGIRTKIREALRYAAPDSPKPSVFLAGQGGRIFTVQEVLAEFDLVQAGGGSPETAVVRGGAVQAGVLTGEVGDVLLLNVLHYGVALGCAYVAHPDNDEDFTVVDAEPVHNRQQLTVIEAQTTIPTKRSEAVRLSNGAGRTHTLEVYELLSGERQLMERREVTSATGHVEVVVDIDANSIVRIEVADVLRADVIARRKQIRREAENQRKRT